MQWFYLLTCFLTLCLGIESKEKIHIVSYSPYYIPGKGAVVNYSRLQDLYEVTFFVDLYKYAESYVEDPEVYKIIFIDYCESPHLAKIPRHKLFCCKWEAIEAALQFYDPYARIYTFDDDLVDGQQFFKFCYPVLLPMLKQLPSFNERKLCTMVAGNYSPSERRAMLEFFATKPLGCFDVYGHPPPEYVSHPMAKGSISGSFSGNAKMNTIKNYRFCICFENTHTTKGYITEKIFDIFAAGCVPVYWGPENVADYIPPNCYIDYRQFEDNEELYQYMLALTEEQHLEYLENIRTYLKSEKAKIFSEEYFENILIKGLEDTAEDTDESLLLRDISIGWDPFQKRANQPEITAPTEPMELQEIPTSEPLQPNITPLPFKKPKETKIRPRKHSNKKHSKHRHEQRRKGSKNRKKNSSR